MIIKIETVIKTDYTLVQEEMELFSSLSPFHKRLFVKQAKQAVSDIIIDHLESDNIDISITIYE